MRAGAGDGTEPLLDTPVIAAPGWQAELNENMKRFCARYEVPSFEDAHAFNGWRIADVRDVGKVFFRTSPTRRAVALIAIDSYDRLWHGPDPHKNRKLYERMKRELLAKNNRATVYVDARHIVTLAVRSHHPEALFLIGRGSKTSEWVAALEVTRRQQKKGFDGDEPHDDDLCEDDWE
jgi:hypothetical protein